MNASTVVSPAARDSRRLSRRTVRSVGLLAAAAATFGLLAGTASPANAMVDAGGAYAYETVTCNSVAHTVSVDTNVVGYGSGVIGGSDLFPYEIQEPAYVQVSEYVGGKWVSSGWKVANGSRHLSISTRGTTYWYFSYAFVTPQNTLVYRSEWAGGGPASGWYADQRGYRTLPSCVS